MKSNKLTSACVRPQVEEVEINYDIGHAYWSERVELLVSKFGVMGEGAEA